MPVGNSEIFFHGGGLLLAMRFQVLPGVAV